MQQTTNFYIYLVILAIASVIGITRYSKMSDALKIIVLLLIVTTVSELSTELVIRLNMGKEVVYRIYSPVEGCFVTLFFYSSLYKVKRRSVITAIIIGWILIGLSNYFFIEKLNLPYLNIILIECFTIIGMSLHALYAILLNDEVQDIRSQPQFWVWIIFLFYWCATFFFWASYKILYRNQSPHLKTFIYYQEMVNILTYASIGFIFLYYRKFIKWQQATK